MPRMPSERPERLLDDLVSIRDLLRAPAPGAPSPFDEIPLLSDVVPVESTPQPAPSVTSAANTGEDTSLVAADQANLVIQQLVDEYMPLLEAELRRRLEAHLLSPEHPVPRR